MRQLRRWIVLGALALGISLGAWIDHSGSELVHSVASGIEAIGTLWLNALRMTVGPLVFSMWSQPLRASRTRWRPDGWHPCHRLVHDPAVRRGYPGSPADAGPARAVAGRPCDRRRLHAGASQGARVRLPASAGRTGCSNCCRRTSSQRRQTTRSWHWWCSRSCSASPRRNCPRRKGMR